MDDTQLARHFRFGENWQEFSAKIGETEIAEAVRGLEKLFPNGELKGKSFLDIGCGSGLSMVAALRLGAARVRGIDIDPISVSTARAVLTRHSSREYWAADEISVFEATPEKLGLFDVVHSWGVLHHTGRMWTATERAGDLVAPGGLLAIALYRRTLACRFWAAEKRLYAHSSAGRQQLFRSLYKAAYALRLLATGKNPARFFAEYKPLRGMDFDIDIHDWLGGYPYESTTPEEATAMLAHLGFRMIRLFDNCASTVGLFGTGCDEFVVQKVGEALAA
jgi:SAM-dependent methyltransferase